MYSLPKKSVLECWPILYFYIYLRFYLLTFTFIWAVPSWLGNEALIGGTHTTASFCWNSLLAQNSLSCPSKKTSMGVSCVSLGVCMVRMYQIFPNASQPWAWGSHLHWGSPMGSVVWMWDQREHCISSPGLWGPTKAFPTSGNVRWGKIWLAEEKGLKQLLAFGPGLHPVLWALIWMWNRTERSFKSQGETSAREKLLAFNYAFHAGLFLLAALSANAAGPEQCAFPALVQSDFLHLCPSSAKTKCNGRGFYWCFFKWAVGFLLLFRKPDCTCYISF